MGARHLGIRSMHELMTSGPSRWRSIQSGLNGSNQIIRIFLHRVVRWSAVRTATTSLTLGDVCNINTGLKHQIAIVAIMDPTKAQTVATFAHLKKDKANKVGKAFAVNFQAASL